MSWWFYFLFGFESVNSILAFLCPFWSCKGNERNFHAWSPYHIFSIASMLCTDIPFVSEQTLIICLLSEVGKGKSSNWYLYLSQLPSYYTILATFNDFETEALQVQLGSSVYKILVLHFDCFMLHSAYYFSGWWGYLGCSKGSSRNKIRLGRSNTTDERVGI